jgi:FkbM family methyltransferase
MTDAPPYGACAPNAFQRACIDFTRAAPPRGPVRAAASLVYRAALAAGDGVFDVDTYGRHIRFHPRDNLADKRALFFPRHWDAVERKALLEAVAPGFVFLDVGANSGLYSLIVAGAAGPAGKVIAVEPQPEVKDWLAFNIAANADGAPIVHVDAAVAGGRGEAELHLPARNRGTASLRGDGGPTVKVPTLGLLDLMDDHGVERADALKIDIEGAEDRVMPPFFEACPRARLPKMILMETLSRDWSVDCVDLAKRAGYAAVADTGRNVVLRLARETAEEPA